MDALKFLNFTTLVLWTSCVLWRKEADLKRVNFSNGLLYRLVVPPSGCPVQESRQGKQNLHCRILNIAARGTLPAKQVGTCAVCRQLAPSQGNRGSCPVINAAASLSTSGKSWAWDPRAHYHATSSKIVPASPDVREMGWISAGNRWPCCDDVRAEQEFQFPMSRRPVQEGIICSPVNLFCGNFFPREFVPCGTNSLAGYNFFRAREFIPHPGNLFPV